MLKIRWPNLPLTRWPVLDRSLSYHGFQGASALKLWGVPFNSWWYFVYLKFQEPPPKIIQDSLTYPGSKINPQFFRLLKGKVISPRWMSTFCAKMKWLFHQLLWVFSYQIKPLYTYQEPFKLEKDNIQPGTTWRTKKSIHPWRLTWNMIMEVWKIIFLSKWMICRFHVNLPECKHQFSSKSSLHKIADVETPLSSDPWSSWRFGFPKVRWFPSPLLPLIFRVKKDGKNFRGVARHLGFFVWGVETEIDVLFMDKTKESKQINLFFEVGDLGHVQVEKKTTLYKWTTSTKQTKNTTIKQRKTTFTYSFNRSSSAVVSLLGVPGRTHGRARPWGWEPGVKFWLQNSSKNGWFSGDFMMIYIDLVI